MPPLDQTAGQLACKPNAHVQSVTYGRDSTIDNHVRGGMLLYLHLTDTMRSCSPHNNHMQTETTTATTIKCDGSYHNVKSQMHASIQKQCVSNMLEVHLRTSCVNSQQDPDLFSHLLTTSL